MSITIFMVILLVVQLILFGVFLYITIKHGCSLLSDVLTLIVCAIAIINLILAGVYNG
jgi:hypothetical protein